MIVGTMIGSSGALIHRYHVQSSESLTHIKPYLIKFKPLLVISRVKRVCHVVVQTSLFGFDVTAVPVVGREYD